MKQDEQIKIYIDGPPLSNVTNIINIVKQLYPEYQVYNANIINYATLHKTLPSAIVIKPESHDKMLKALATLNQGDNYYISVVTTREGIYNYMNKLDEVEELNDETLLNIHNIHKYHAALTTVCELDTIEVSENLSYEVPVVIQATIDYIINKRRETRI